MGEGYEKTKPWHPLYNIVVFTLFGYLYSNVLESPSMQEAFLTGLIWAALCVVFDAFGWMIIKHPRSMTAH